MSDATIELVYPTQWFLDLPLPILTGLETHYMEARRLAEREAPKQAEAEAEDVAMSDGEEGPGGQGGEEATFGRRK